MRPKINEQGTSLLEFVQQVADEKKKHPHKSIEEIATDLYGPNMIEGGEDESIFRRP